MWKTRTPLIALAGLCLLLTLASASRARQQATNKTAAAPYLAMGLKVGEVTPNSAIIWSRATAKAERKQDGERRVGTPRGRNAEMTEEIDVNGLEGSVPGAAGQMRFGWSSQVDWSDIQYSDWTNVNADGDFCHQIQVTDLQPNTKYYVRAEVRVESGPEDRAVRDFTGSFTTAPAPDQWQDINFGVITCQAYKDLDHPDGFKIYPAMTALDLDFFVPAGDNVYYDNELPRARTVELARYHWQRMYSLPRIVQYHRHVPAYWEKDDHDTLSDDAWPGKSPRWMAPMTWDDGLEIFRQQVPMGDKTFRTFRWGKGLQIWLIEGRDFRSPNNMPDGPEKTILGKEQLAWLQKSVEESDADFRVLISPTPIVGPDRENKNDNHANIGFSFEGNLLRKWAGGLQNFYVCCGDRHWQYMSVDPKTGLREFSCGAASNEHAGGSPGQDKEYQPFHRVKGGFLSVSVTKDSATPTITFRFHDVDGNVVYEFAEEGKQ